MHFVSRNADGAFTPDGSNSSISCYLWDYPVPDSNHQELLASPSTLPPAHVGAPATCTHKLTYTDSHTLTHPHRLALTTGVHTRTLIHSHAQTHLVLHSYFNSLQHPRWSHRLASDTGTSPSHPRRPQSRSGAGDICLWPNRAHRLCYKIL